MMDSEFENKVALITGGAAGFGKAFAVALSKLGCDIAIADIDLEGASALAKDLTNAGRKAIALRCDVGDAASARDCVAAAVDQLGGIDILINNAAKHLVKYNRPFGSLSDQDIVDLFNVNVMGVITLSLACRASMASRGGGSIVNIASGAAFTSRTPYGVTKLALRGLTVAFASEFAADNIRVNAIAPTRTETEGAVAAYTDEEFEEAVTQRQFIQRRGTMDDVTGALLFLCSAQASFITGETLRVTGGAHMTV